MLSVMPKVLFVFSLKCLPTAVSTEIVGLTPIYEFINGGHMADLHTADRILEASFVAPLFHRYLLKYLGYKFHCSTRASVVCDTCCWQLPGTVFLVAEGFIAS
jgi:hypothetical protein